ncbi:MAG: rRNA maturation RNase YbeY [Acidobacteria bacterium]|nr:rRNA maturation RNase YbeY [Acidobacteriota bacterium]
MTTDPDDPDGHDAAEAAVRTPLQVVVTDGRGRPRPPAGLPGWLTRVAPRAARGDMAVALVGDAKMRALNRQFRGIDRPTDVLSFPAGAGERRPRYGRRWLGDIVIATGVARRQARARGCALDVEYRRLALHGLLHLLGYDHTRDDGQMERLERRLWRKGGMTGEAL